MPYLFYINDVLFPVTPPKITTKIQGKNKTIDLINEGEVNLIKTPALTEIEIEDIMLPGAMHYPFAYYNHEKNGHPNIFLSPKYYLNKLEVWKKSKKPVALKIIRSTPDGKNLLFDTNMDVTVEDYEIEEDADNGLDIYVKLSLKEYRKYGAKRLIIKKTTKKTTSSSKKKVVKKTASKKKKNTAKTYVIKKGDTLPNIAKKQLGSAKYSSKIYNLNKSVIEKAAKKHGKKSSSKGWFIYPGTKLKLPSV